MLGVTPTSPESSPEPNHRSARQASTIRATQYPPNQLGTIIVPTRITHCVRSIVISFVHPGESRSMHDHRRPDSGVNTWTQRFHLILRQVLVRANRLRTSSPPKVRLLLTDQTPNDPRSLLFGFCYTEQTPNDFVRLLLHRTNTEPPVRASFVKGFPHPASFGLRSVHPRTGGLRESLVACP